MQKRKKKREGTSFSNTKALKCSELRKQGGSTSNGDDRQADVFDIFNDDDMPLEFRQNLKIYLINQETVLESDSTKVAEDGKE